MASSPARRDERSSSPEDFLRAIEKSRRGRLKVYVGHAAGTGKTVRMLHEGNELLARGKRVVGAYIETHGRKGTEAAVGCLPLIPRKRVEYRGAVLGEMDLDEALRLGPEIAIVDELPHSNAPGCRNAKRWQDVDELLDAGISVITALNIQHVESLNPVVERITGVRVQEVVPDSFLAEAEQVVNIDISPADLRERMRRGEVYTREKAEVALANFFTSENLDSLRELALREVVRFLEQGRRRARTPSGEGGEIAYLGRSDLAPSRMAHSRREGALASPVSESVVDPVVMVAISSRPPDARCLLRKAAAIAHRLNTHWYLAYVETPREDSARIDATTQRLLMNNICMAKDLGATVVRLKGRDVAATLAGFATEYGITHAIFGGSPPAAGVLRGISRLLGRGDIASRFHRLAPGIDLHVAGSRPL